MKVYELIEPMERCVDQDGHGYVEMFTLGDAVPVMCVCPDCGSPWHIAMWDAPDDKPRG